MNGKHAYEAGSLTEALKAMVEEVKQHPTDTSRRGFLCELLAFNGDVERLDKHLDLMGDQDPQAVMGVSVFRHLARAELARQQFFGEGRLPEFLDNQPTEVLRMHLEASILVREGNLAGASALLAEAETKRPRVSGVCDGTPFDEIRDLDDLCSPFAEVLTTNGKYYWIPWERMEVMELREIKRPRDLLWRRCHMQVASGPDGEVYLPCVYAGSHKNPDERVKLGRVTDWEGGEGTPVRGLGLRTLLIGNEDRTILQIKHLEFSEASA